MSNGSGSDTELTPEATEVLAMILEDTRRLREVDLGDTPPATVFEAG